MKKYVLGWILICYQVLAFADDLLGLPVLPTVINNPQTAAKIALGKRLFNDVRLSQDGTVSCASCHQQSKAFTDGQKVAVGFKGQQGLRNAPTVVNAAYYQRLFVDGRAASLEEQALGPFLNPIEHGLKSKRQLVKLVEQDTSYKKQFVAAFASPTMTADNITFAIASFERTLIAGNSAFDRYLFGRDRKALTQSEARGMRLFRRKGNCANCHEISGKDALFMDNRFYNIGVGFDKINPEIEHILTALRQGDKLETLNLTEVQHAELGRFNVTHMMTDIGQFKTPTLRNIALTAPYMHDGSLETLEDVVEYYDKGGHKNPYLDAAIFPLHFTAQEKQYLVAFLKALTSQAYQVD